MPGPGRSLAAPGVALLAALLACARPPPEDPEAVAAAIWAERCANCHGPEGRGDGPGGAALFPPPRSFHDLEWQAQVGDADIRAAILYGGPAVGRSAGMLPNPDLRDRPDVVAALVRLVRGWRSAAPAAR